MCRMVERENRVDHERSRFGVRSSAFSSVSELYARLSATPVYEPPQGRYRCDSSGVSHLQCHDFSSKVTVRYCAAGVEMSAIKPADLAVWHNNQL